MSDASKYEVVMPKLSDQMTEAAIATWLFSDGATVARGDEIAEVETDKATVGLEAERDGVLRIVVPAGTSVALGELVAFIGPEDFVPPSADAPAAEGARGEDDASPAVPPTTASGSIEGDVARRSTSGRPFASPLVRRLAAANGLDLSGVVGSGPRGRIVKRDIEALLSTTPAAAGHAPAPVPPAPVPGGEDTVIRMSRRQRIVAERMQAAKQSIPEFTATVDVDVTALAEIRRRLSEVSAAVPSYNAFLTKAVAMAARQHPMTNARVEGDTIIQYADVNVGIAVSAGDDLLVPVVRHADRLSPRELHEESRRLAEAVRQGSIDVGDLQGGTITVSNLGMLGVKSFQAIINANQTVIVAIGAVVPTPVVHEGDVAVRDIVSVTVTADHRAVYGADAARFLSTVQHLLREPLQLAV